MAKRLLKAGLTPKQIATMDEQTYLTHLKLENATRTDKFRAPEKTQKPGGPPRRTWEETRADLARTARELQAEENH
jgi:hypothetical protein